MAMRPSKQRLMICFFLHFKADTLRSTMQRLGDDLLWELGEHILEFLDMPDRARLAQVQYAWMYLCDQDEKYRDFRDRHAFLHEMLHDDSWDEDDERCSCGCGAPYDMFCYVQTYKMEMRDGL